MPRRKSMGCRRRPALVCAQCGNTVFWSLYRIVLAVEHWKQAGPQSWRRLSVEKRRFDLPLDLCVVCEGCGHPAAVPQTISTMNWPRKRPAAKPRTPLRIQLTFRGRGG